MRSLRDNKKNSVRGDNSYKVKVFVTRCQFHKRINCSISYTIYLSDILRNKKTAKEKNVGGRKKIIIIIIRTKTIGLSSERLKDLIKGKKLELSFVLR